MDAAGLCEVAQRIAADGDGEARDRLAQYVQRRLVEDPSGVWAVRLSQWRMLTENLRWSLARADRAVWAGAIKSAYAGDGDSLKAMGDADFRDLAKTLGYLGDPSAVEVMGPWIEAKRSWRDWPAEELVDFLGRHLRPLEYGPVASFTRAQNELVEHIADNVLADPAKARAVSVDRWHYLAETLMSGQSPRMRRRWIAGIRAGFVADEGALAKLGTKRDVEDLLQTLRELGDRNCGNVVAAWVKHDPAWSTLETKDIAKLCLHLCNYSPAGDEEVVPALETMAEKLIADISSDEADGVGAALPALAYAEMHCGDMAAAQDWAKKAYVRAFGSEETSQTVTADGLLDLATMLQYVGLTGEDMEFGAFAASTARLAEAGKFDRMALRDLEPLAVAFTTPATRTVVAEALCDAEGMVRPRVAGMLAWAHRYGGSGNEWTELLDERLAASADGDQKAGWLLAKGFAEMVARVTGPASSDGMAAFREAFDEADSDAQRVICLEHIAYWCCRTGDFDRGLAMLGDAAEQAPRVKDEAVRLADAVRWERMLRAYAEIDRLERRAAGLEDRAEEAAAAGDDRAKADCLRRAAMFRLKQAALTSALNP